MTKLDKFLDLVYDSDADLPAAQLRSELAEAGVNMAKVDAWIGALSPASGHGHSAAPKPAPLPDWVSRARTRQARFEERIRALAARTRIPEKYHNARELLAGMLAGELGSGLQTRATVFFRNRKGDEPSEQDLKSFIEDCELLDHLEELEPK